jgi:hypothetical protein
MKANPARNQREERNLRKLGIVLDYFIGTKIN